MVSQKNRQKLFHPSILPLIFCIVVIALDIFALATGRIKLPKYGEETDAEPEEELAANPRSRSAKLRIAEKL